MAEEKNMKILGRCTLQKDGRMVIPKKVRELLGINTGDKVNLNLEGLNDDVLVITKA